jgi:hypothetical protein
VKSHDNEHLVPGGPKSVGGLGSDAQPDVEDGVEQCEARHEPRHCGMHGDTRTITLCRVRCEPYGATARTDQMDSVSVGRWAIETPWLVVEVAARGDADGQSGCHGWHMRLVL